MSSVARRLLATLLTLVACAADPRRPRRAREDPAAAEVKVVKSDPADQEVVAAPERATPAAPELSGPALLGAKRSQIEAAIGAPRQTRGEWVEYAELSLRYRGERCVGLRRQVPAGLDCEAAARWLGYPDAGAPLRRDDRCEWPGISLRHRLAPGVAGTLVLAGGHFELRLL